MKNITLISFFVINSLGVFAQQLDINADLRTRYEMRNGYGTLKPDSSRAANFITQRARMSFDYSNDHLKLRISPQNVKVWGNVATMALGDLNNSFHEAYGEAILNKYFSFKIGRQEINYDDARILGNVDWAMQARSHDALLFKINPDTNNRIHLGFAFNANKETNFQEKYLVPQYKAMQFLWYHGNFKKFGVSFLALNNGSEYTSNLKEKIAFSQTVGPRLTYQNSKLKLNSAAYIQSGNIANNEVNALYYSANASLTLWKKFTAGLGFEYLSGKSNLDKSKTIKSFNPLYGTNHKFNGYMDYFYVGNHSNNVGLTDVYASLVYSRNKVTVKLEPHYFMTSADLYKGTVKQDNALGTELDLTIGYKLMDNVKIDAGYSQLFATSSMEVIKGGSMTNTNNWFYLSVIFNPQLFSFKSGLTNR